MSLVVKCGIQIEARFKEDRREKDVGEGMKKKKPEPLIL